MENSIKISSINKLGIEKNGYPKKLSYTETSINEKVVELVHELRNPLASINLSLDILKYQIKNKDLEIYLNVIRHSTKQVNDLIGHLLQSFNTTELRTVSKHSINQLLDETLEMAQDRIMLKNIRVQKFYTQASCEISIDEPKIKIALLNIIINALEAMPVKNGKLRLITELCNGKCIVAIEDNGIGISKANIAKLFEPYYTSKPTGMGLGLSATRNILQSHGAVVEVQSEENKGTRFIISFNLNTETIIKSKTSH